MESLRLRIIEAKAELDFIRDKNISDKDYVVPDLRREYFAERKYKELLEKLNLNENLNGNVSVT